VKTIPAPRRGGIFFAPAPPMRALAVRYNNMTLQVIDIQRKTAKYELGRLDIWSGRSAPNLSASY
jgi:hypothetical protein